MYKRVFKKLMQEIVRRRVDDSSLVFAMTVAYGLSGGIASLNRNIFLVLVSLAKELGITLHVLALHEFDTDIPTGLVNENISFVGFEGDTKKFSLSLIRLSL